MITKATIEILDQGLSLLEKVSDEDYVHKLSIAYNASIGGHYRHILEHFTSLYENHAEGFVNYDLRKRDQEIETCRDAAIRATRNLKERWASIENESYEERIELNGKLSHSSEDSMNVQSSVGREVVYSIAHAHHHFAIIGIMCAVLESPAGENFGVAPSTAQHLKEKGEKALVAH